MGTEIERKFLVKGDAWRSSSERVVIIQGYLSRDERRVVRVRTLDEKGFITIKGIRSGAVRREFEYSIPHADATEMLKEMCLPPLIHKTRHALTCLGFRWTVDEFHAPQAGLILAEIELPSAQCAFPRPDWIGEEVTHDSHYYNQNMA
jgi:adenylate cyclase